MTTTIKVSVCIPAYKNVQFLQKALDSLVMQDYTDWEIIITDDSPDDSVYQLAEQYFSRLPLHYYKNEPAAGMPANWNVCYDKARGAYIKIMHDDDWFTHPQAVRKMAEALDARPGCDFVFSAFRNCYLGSGKTEDIHCSAFYRGLLGKGPEHLFQKNFIGPPSVVMHRNNAAYRYDVKLRWMVDKDFYINVLQHVPAFIYLDEVLVNIGISENQITQSVKGVRKVEVPENFYLLSKTGEQHLHNIYVYDFFWRLMRNLGVRQPQELKEAGLEGPVPALVEQILQRQRLFPLSLLKIGPVSKLLMALSYAFRQRNI